MNKNYGVPWVVSGIFLVVGIVTLPDYGMNWDSAYRMMRGQAFGQILLTGKGEYGLPERVSPVLFDPGEYVTRYDFLAGEGDRPSQATITGGMWRKGVSYYQDEAWNGEYFKANDEPGHPPLIDILGAISNRVWYQKLGVMGDIDSYKIVYVVLSAVGVWVVTRLVMDITGSGLAGVVAGMSLGLWPIWFAEAHFNMKDPLQASMYAGAVWSWWRKKWGLFVVFVAVALNIKWNIVFLPIVLLGWLLFTKKKLTGKMVISGIMAVITGLVMMVAIWPRAWSNPIGWIGQVAGYYKGFGISQDHLQPKGWFWGLNFYPVVLTLAQTPEIVLILAGLGGVIGWRRYKQVTMLICLWMLVPTLRQMLPFVKSYSGMRQIMEVIPALAVLAGMGASYLRRRMSINFITFVIFIIIIVEPIVRLHPNENVYFNQLVGGLKGAYERNLVDGMITYGNVYKSGVEWLNRNAELGAKLAILDGYGFAAAPVFIREDISISADYFSGFEQKGEYFMVVYKPNDQAVFAQMYPKRLLEPVYEVKVDGVALLSIYKNERMKFKEQKIDFKIRGPEVMLEKEVLVTRLVVEAVDCAGETSSAYVDELVEFREGVVYGLMERRVNGDRVEWWFPAEKATKMRIYPKSSESCFNHGRLIEVWGG